MYIDTYNIYNTLYIVHNFLVSYLLFTLSVEILAQCTFCASLNIYLSLFLSFCNIKIICRGGTQNALH